MENVINIIQKVHHARPNNIAYSIYLFFIITFNKIKILEHKFIMAQSTPLSQLPPVNGDNGMNIQMIGMDDNSPHQQPNNPQMNNNPLIPSQHMPQDNNQLVDDILADMGEPPMMEPSNIDNAMMNRAMDRSQIPQEKQYDMDEDYNYNQEKHNLDNSMLLDAVGVSESSTIGKAYNTVKYPLLVFLVCFIVSLPQLNRLLFSMIPTLLLESGQVSLQGVALKSFIGMVLFYLLSLVL